MHEPFDLGHSTGDQCALCAELLDEESTNIELDDGRLLHVCGACAADRASIGPGEDEDSAPAEAPAATTTEKARSLIAAMVEQRTREHSSLRELADLVDKLEEETARSQMSGLGFEERIRALETELERTREQLRRAEDLLAAPRPAALANTPADGVTAAAHFPQPAPELVVSVTELTGEDVRMSQRLFNESPFTEKTRSVRRSLGRPIVNLARVSGPGRKTLLTAAWDIIWYQYLVDLAPEPDEAPVTLFAEGMELTELSAAFKEANGIMDEQGRVDASELELGLERDHPAHVAAREDENDQHMDDATQEIWGKTSMPEFRWDD